MKPRVYIGLIILGAVAITSACETTEVKDKAGIKLFYYEFIDNVDNDYTQNLIAFANEVLPEYDYFISEASANRGWPYFEKVERGTPVLITDVMPPHSTCNRLLPTGLGGEGHALKAVFTINQDEADKISITKQGFVWEDEQWKPLIMSITTEFNAQPANTEEEFYKISKTLIRYTFK